MDSLQDVNEKDIPKLLEVLKRDWPLSIHVSISIVSTACEGKF